MKALVTGSSGFIGSHFMRVIENFDFEISTSTRDKDFDVIFSIASGAEASESIKNPRSFIRNNTNLMIDLLEFARENSQLKHFIHLSTSEVYGPCEGCEDKQEWSAIITHSPYAASKAAQEAFCMAHWKTFGVPVTIVNTMNVFGEMQQKHKFIPMAVENIISGNSVPIHGGPGNETKRRYIHAEDVAHAMISIALHPYKPEENRCQRFNVVGDEEISLAELASKIAKILNKDFSIKLTKPSRPGHGGRYSLNGEKIKSLGWKPEDFQKNLERTVRFIAERIAAEAQSKSRGT